MDLGTLKQRAWRKLDESADEPVRYTSELLNEAINDGIQLFMTRTSLDVSTVVISQIAGTLWYPLPSDCIRVLSVRRDETDVPLDPRTWRELDSAGAEFWRWRWGDQFADSSSDYLIFGLNEIGLWPLVATSGMVTSATSGTVMTEAFTLGIGEDSVTLASDPDGEIACYLNGLRMKPVTIPTAIGEYTTAGSVVVFQAAGVSAGDEIDIEYDSSAGDWTRNTVPTGTKNGSNTSFTLPTTGVAYRVFHNGKRLVVTSEYTISSSTLTLVIPPNSADILLVDVLSSTTNFVVAEVPDGDMDSFNRIFTLAAAPHLASDSAFWVNGIRLGRSVATPDASEAVVESNIVTLGIAPDSSDTLVSDYIRPTTAGAETYTVTYVRDVGESVDDDTDELPLPTEYDSALVEYVVGRMLLVGARGERLQTGVQHLTRFDNVITVATQRLANLARINRSDGTMLR